jgi:integrase
VVHGYPILVFDTRDQISIALTLFAREGLRAKAAGTASAYLYAILPFHTYLETDRWQQGAGRSWDGPADQVRLAVADYLMQRLGCRVSEHRRGFHQVELTRDTPRSIGVFLSGLKFFYRVMQAQGLYTGESPLVDITAGTVQDILDSLDQLNEYPRMPAISGVANPPPRWRLTDSYFCLKGDQWIPQVIDDPALPRRVLAGGERVGWHLREQAVTRLLFESGGRVSEVVGLTLGDWDVSGRSVTATAFSKGSHGRRVKTLRFAPDTAKLLARYFDGERRMHDPVHRTIADYVRLRDAGRVDLYDVPLFLSARGSALTAKNYRDNYWQPACRAASIDADVHQARHWFVTMYMREVYETVDKDGAVARAKGDLIAYMGWRSGESTLAAYEHHFQAARAAQVQDRIHARMRQALRERSAGPTRAATRPLPPPSGVVHDEELAFLERALR